MSVVPNSGDALMRYALRPCDRIREATIASIFAQLLWRMPSIHAIIARVAAMKLPQNQENNQPVSVEKVSSPWDWSLD